MLEEEERGSLIIIAEETAGMEGTRGTLLPFLANKHQPITNAFV